jgi:hypothetical protein
MSRRVYLPRYSTGGPHPASQWPGDAEPVRDLESGL